ncbi:Uncharacterised protein [uncultured archaeon]|nr:Uncharacterised protein [uncultured archaeon]
MKKVFIGQAVTGQDIESLKKEMERVYSALSQAGYKPYSTLEEEGRNKFQKAGDWIRHAFETIDKHDIFLAIVRTEHRSEGMLMEIGYVLSKKKKLVLAINKNVKNSYLADVADEVIEWETLDELESKLEKLKI